MCDVSFLFQANNIITIISFDDYVQIKNVRFQI